MIDIDEDETTVPPLVYAEDLSRNGTFWNGRLIGRGNGGFLLSDGDVLRLSPRVEIVYHCSDIEWEQGVNRQYDPVQAAEKKVCRGCPPFSGDRLNIEAFW